MKENTQKKERYILIAVDYGQDYPVERSLEELALLVDTAGGEVVDTVIQNMSSPSPATYLGSGKVEELSVYIEEENRSNRILNSAENNALDENIDQDYISGVIADDELSPAQMANLAMILGIKVLDRTMVILDIFAQHATTSEGKIQVEMAQLEYQKSRLSGSFGQSLSRQGGGIGTRGPGETQLETDRRVIRSRISTLRHQIKEMERTRDTSRKKRGESGIPVVAIVGYTNAGKSTLLNHITDSEVLMQDQLFATLDPTTRSGVLPDGQKLLFTDTVGFIHKLPHHLVDAFRSTLEEAKYADVILHVVDASDPDLAMHMEVVYDTLRSLKVEGKPIITVFNKIDRVADDQFYQDPRAEKCVRTSAKTGEGLEKLYETLSEILKSLRVYVDRVIPYSDGRTVHIFHEHGQILSEEYEADGVHLTAYIPRRYL